MKKDLRSIVAVVETFGDQGIRIWEVKDIPGAEEPDPDFPRSYARKFNLIYDTSDYMIFRQMAVTMSEYAFENLHENDFVAYQFLYTESELLAARLKYITK